MPAQACTCSWVYVCVLVCMPLLLAHRALTQKCARAPGELQPSHKLTLLRWGWEPSPAPGQRTDPVPPARGQVSAARRSPRAGLAVLTCQHLSRLTGGWGGGSLNLRHHLSREPTREEKPGLL